MIRVAVIDDEDAARNMMERLLRQEGFQVTTFQAGKPFLASMQQAPFDLVFIDLKLPDIEGIEVLQMAKQAYADTEAIITGRGRYRYRGGGDKERGIPLFDQTLPLE